MMIVLVPIAFPPHAEIRLAHIHHPLLTGLGNPIEIAYRGSTTAVVNNGHTLQVDVDPGNSLEIDGQTTGRSLKNRFQAGANWPSHEKMYTNENERTTYV
jgi:carbonic anhydrase